MSPDDSAYVTPLGARLLKSAQAQTDGVVMKGKGELAQSGVVIVCALAALAGCGGGSSEKQTRSYTRVEVEHAFAAEGLPLIAPFGRGVAAKATILMPRDGRLSNRFSVIVYDLRMASGALGISVRAGHRFVRLGNVIVTFAPRGHSVSAVQAAIAKLRSM
jgi:hypothetical protein